MLNETFSVILKHGLSATLLKAFIFVLVSWQAFERKFCINGPLHRADDVVSFDVLTCLDYDEKTPNGYNPNLGGPVHFWQKERQKRFWIIYQRNTSTTRVTRSRGLVVAWFLLVLLGNLVRNQNKERTQDSRLYCRRNCYFMTWHVIRLSWFSRKLPSI